MDTRTVTVRAMIVMAAAPLLVVIAAVAACIIARAIAGA